MERIYEELIAPKVKNTKVGDVLMVMEEDEDEKGSKIRVKYTVIQVFPYIVLCKNQRGKKRCFCYGDLVMLGKEG